MTDNRPSTPPISDRLKWVLTILLAVLLIFVWSELREARVNQESQMSDLATSIASLSIQDGNTVWAGRLESVSEIREAWTARTWQGQTPGLVSAEVQRVLTELAANVGLENARIFVASDPITVRDSDLIRFEVTAIADTDAILKFIVGIATARRNFYATEINAPMSENRKSRVSVAGHVVILVDAESEQE